MKLIVQIPCWNAARRLNVLTTYTYTLETLIQAGQCGLTVRSVPVSVNRKLLEEIRFPLSRDRGPEAGEGEEPGEQTALGAEPPFR